MRLSQFPLLGLLLALLVGARVGTPGKHLGSNASPVGTNKPEKKSPLRKTATQAGGSTSVTREDCNSISASAKDEALQLSPPPRGPRPCVSPLSPFLKEICKLNPSYPSDKLPSNEELAGLSDAAVVKRCLDSNMPTIVSVMASVANPLRTHLGLMTDRAIEAIQVAAAEANFLPQSHYLPWPPPPSNSDSEAPAEPQDSNSTEPGVLIFRNNDDQRPSPQYLVVFLIPELPTEGLDRKVFAVAESIIEQISAVDGSQLLFAGPSFSGSVTSLEEINRDLVRNKCVFAFSSVTNPPSNLIQQPGCPEITFTRTTNCKALDSFMTGVLTFGYRREQIAILSEAGTQYGTQQLQCLPSGERPLLFLNFPREISKLRNAYGAETSSGTQAASANPQTDLQMSWQDLEVTRGDDVQTYGRAQTPLSQETVLSSLSITLKAKGIKALGILATDPMDEAFLIHSIKQSSPDVRLFLRDPDLLYLRTPDAASLNGTLLVSDNPLIPQNQFWSSPPQDAARNRLITFPSANQESQYNAFVLLLEKAKLAPPSIGKMRLLEWGWPAGTSADSDAPQMGAAWRPLWLTTIGTAANYPVKILNSQGIDEARQALHSLDVGKLSYAPLVLWAAVAMLGILHVLGLRFKEAVPSVLREDFDLTDQGSPVTLVKRSSHLIAILIIALAQMILGSSYFFFCHSGWRYTLTACAVALLTTFLLWRAWLQSRVLRFAWLEKGAVTCEGVQIIDLPKVLKSTLIASTIVVLAGIVWLWITMRSHFENAFLHFRDLNLASGVAIALPIVSVLMIMYFGIWAYLRRLAYWNHRYVAMFDLKLDKVIPQNLTADVAAIDQCLLGPLENWKWILGFAVTFGISIAAFRPWRTLDILEPLGVWWFLFCFFTLALSILWLNWFRFLNIWVHLRNILEHLEYLPIRAAFERMPRDKSLPILQWGESRNPLLPQVLDRLRALVRVYGIQQNVSLLRDFQEKVIALTNAENVYETALVQEKVVGGAPRWTLHTFSRSRKELVEGARHEMTNVTETLSDWLLEEYWSRGASDKKEDEDTEPVNRKFVLAEDIVALPFYAYIHRVISELRNVLFFLGIAVSLLFAALHTYAFRADQAIDWWFFGLFVFLGGGIVFIVAQMERNPLLSRLSATTPGKLGTGFYVGLLKYGTIPFLTIFASQVPSISNLVLKWVQPALEALH